VITSTLSGLIEDIVVSIVILLIASLRYDGGTVFQGAISRRSEIVFVVGLRLISETLLDLDQSRYSVESFFSQKERSSASLLNSGMTLRSFLICFFIGAIPSGIKKGEKMSDCDWKGAFPLQIVVTVNGVSTTVVISEKDAS
jgi:hypothetical protein